MTSHDSSSTSMSSISQPKSRGANRSISPSLKTFTMRCVDANLLTVQQCASLGAFSLSTGNRLRNEWLEHNCSLGPPKTGFMSGRPRSMNPAAVEALKDVLKLKEDITLKEIQQILIRFGFESFSISLLSRQLKRMGLSKKEVAKAQLLSESGGVSGTSQSLQSGSFARPKAKAKRKDRGAGDGAQSFTQSAGASNGASNVN
ncbi:hypothetical protein BCV69DRAFT_301747 [Microstroma glucosiphilum]|uniref:Uncharacterized protein n=1 Tax=Pseudomicrostroma glucosiphilum TaxID=1684307 RepID=A0A316TXN9_9BASI|nr:hypothetical protein BCV69DRAFT_301747 [Pseudomicrostroma glucosiphilum]PWN18007.1 hypothetical protein BCV69DRAFT_301747 [Pseudomicrostroma glucosiphilum]